MSEKNFIVSGDTDKMKLNGMVKEIIASKTKIKDAQSHIKDVRTRAKEELGIEASVLNSLVSERMEDKVSTRHGDDEQIISLHEELVALEKRSRSV